MAKNIDMLKRIKAQWDAVPESVYMPSWGYQGDGMRREYALAQLADETLTYYNPNTGRVEDYTPETCGTTRCLAGWAIHFAAADEGIDMATTTLEDAARELGYSGSYDMVNYDDAGMEILGLTGDEASVFWNDETRAYNKVEEWIKNG